MIQNTHIAFPTPVLCKSFDDSATLNRDVQSFILDWRSKDQGVQRSNVGGWHSTDDLLQKLGEPHAPTLARMFLSCVHEVLSTILENPQMPKQLSVEAWAIVNEAGDSNAAHIHPHCPWSGVYYVASEQDAGGDIGFTDPRTQALALAHPTTPWHAHNNLRISPKPGTMVVFPSFLYHWVEVYRGKTPRISIAFNLR
jgi:uncharacterized protein (TIGR02466 family)